MNKFLPLGAAAISASFAVPGHSDVGPVTNEVPTVVVSAARTEQSTLTTPASITVISRQQIEDSGAADIVEVLRGQGGVQIKDLYGDGSRATVDMRGFGDSASSNTLVLIDGRRLNNPDIASPDLNAIALDDVERIEVVQGSAGVLFGDQAVGGVINVITRRPGAMRHSLKLSAGSYNAVNLHAMTSQALDNGINYRVSLDARESDNYRDHNELSYLNGFAKLAYDYSSGSVFTELQYIDNDLNTPGALFADEVAEDRRQANASFASDYSNAKTTVGRIGLVQEISSNWSFEGEVTSRKTDGDFRISFAGGLPSTGNYTQNRKIQEFTPRFIGFIPALNNTMLTIGADAVESEYDVSTIFGDQFNDQSQRSLYAQALIPASMLDFTVGVRHARVDNELRDAGMFAVYPTGVNIEDEVTVATLGLAIKANDNWRLLLRADQNYRFAKVDEFLQPAFTPAFSPIELKTQEGLSLETGAEWSRGGNSAKVVVYSLKLENEVAYDPANFANINLDDTERKGLITSGYWQATQRIGFSASYTYTDAEVTSGFATGKDIPLVAEHSALLSTDYVISTSWQVFAEVVAISDRVLGGDFDNTLSTLPGYGVFNIKAGYQVSDFTFSGRINNVFNKKYSDVGQLGFDPNAGFAAAEAFYPSPEINFLLTAAWNFR
ncbi:MAG: TonB-dependent receptor [Gammaproteobacteria bacterium]|nr:TonB-dependent receptor [Gammaproteobacteria bacterium]NNJ49592.1 TonB-dependent receptor [Gammaproteobacteria bacterium]